MENPLKKLDTHVTSNLQLLISWIVLGILHGHDFRPDFPLSAIPYFFAPGTLVPAKLLQTILVVRKNGRGSPVFFFLLWLRRRLSAIFPVFTQLPSFESGA